MRHLIILLLTTLFLTGCATGEKALMEKGIEPMTASQLQQIISDNTMIGKSSGGSAFSALYRSDGTVSAKSGSERDSGTWDINEEGHLCEQWNNWDSGQRVCYKMYMVEDEVRFYDLGGSYIASGKIVQGNPENF